mmetsp:Transcript_153859/g.271581  ORF Transcript_153859/g.271581 Transcript_153859/m.271581 type:complete len:115 (-) Transcript_153859:1183-1527(-)
MHHLPAFWWWCINGSGAPASLFGSARVPQAIAAALHEGASVSDYSWTPVNPLREPGRDDPREDSPGRPPCGDLGDWVECGELAQVHQVLDLGDIPAVLAFRGVNGDGGPLRLLR